jgi:hypothetical protein
MPSVDDKIDRLYQGPLGDFTAARNALARQAGNRATEVRALTKPNAAAWAVNQLFWHQRAVFDALAAASERRRAAHVQRIGGRETDVDAAEARHQAALAEARAAVHARLTAAGETLSPATVAAVDRTLEAVPAPEIRGRLTRPLEPVGFSLLAGLMASAPERRPPGKVVMMGRRASPPAATLKASTKAAAAAQARARAEVVRDLSAAKTRERQATAALAAGRHAVDRAERRVERIEADLAAARAAAAEARDALVGLRRSVNDAAAERIALERRRAEFD